jgi:stearoyl-CoA desaturase (delta-9 desaturase)
MTSSTLSHRHFALKLLERNLLHFAYRYFWQLTLTFTFLIPISVPCLLWGETWWNATFPNIARWVLQLNFVWSVNSFAHLYGYHPYDR